MELGRPMLADNKPWNPAAVESNLPLAGFIKLDGIRCLVHDGVGYSRSLKPLPNKSLQAKIAANKGALEGFDGEIIVGNLTDEFCFKNSHRACMKGDLEADHKFYVFDMWNQRDTPYMIRHGGAGSIIDSSHYLGLEVIHMDYIIAKTMEEVDTFKDDALAHGHEGTIWRRPDAPYKNGRATTKTGWMYKHKSRVDTEVVVTGFNELMINNNPKTTNELGQSQRSTHQENKVPGDTVGSVEVGGTFEVGRPFACNIGVFSGFSKEDLQKIWNSRDQFIGQYLKIKYMGIGSDQSPRTPVALGFRDPIDMS